MALTREQHRQLEKALLAAFPRAEDLARMVRQGLDENLVALAGGDSLTDQVFSLLQWAEARDQIPALLTAALTDNPTNSQLRTIATALGQPMPILAPGIDAANGPPPSPSSPTSPEVGPFLVPYPHNRYFFGRDAILDQIAILLAPRRPVVVTGVGGLGKTQVAVQYAHQHQAEYPGGVVWLVADPPEGIAAQVAKLTSSSTGFGKSELSQADQIAIVQRSWSDSTARLFIFDNLEDPQVLQAWQPKGSRCHVLITTQQQVWSRTSGVQAVPLPPLDAAASLQVLLGTPLPDPLPSGAAQICELLGHLPLALALAAAYHEESPTIPLVRYADDLAAQTIHHSSLTGGFTGELPTGHTPSVLATFDLSYKRLNPADPSDAQALALLHVAAEAAPDPIPADLLTRAVAADPATLPDESATAPAFNRLFRLGLLEYRSYRVHLHRLLAAYVRDHNANRLATQVALARALVAAAHAADLAGDNWAARGLLPHMRHVYTQELDSPTVVAALVERLAYLLFQLRDYTAARPLAEHARIRAETVWGTSTLETALALNTLGLILNKLADYATARPVLEQALIIREQTASTPARDTARSLHNLAGVLQEQGELAAARCTNALWRFTSMHWGAHHPNTATSLSNLAGVL